MILLNGVKIPCQDFPNGESLIKGFEIKENRVVLTMIFENDLDFMKLFFIKKHIDEVSPKCEVVLYMPYCPYSRMDRTEKNKTVFTLKYVADMINSMNFSKVYTLEPHSDVCMALINRISTPADLTLTLGLIPLAIEEKNEDKVVVVYPDAGAAKRYGKSLKCKNVVCNKKRDFETGRIISLEVSGLESLPEGFVAVILDDLCSRGGTFILTAKKLREMGASKIYLCVTHMEYAAFEGDLFNSGLIDVVFVTNSIIDKEDPRVIEMEKERKLIVSNVRDLDAIIRETTTV